MAYRNLDDKRHAAAETSQEHDGVLSRDRLTELDIDAHMVAREIASGRWARHGRQTVSVHTGELSEVARRWRAVWEVGVDVAAVDGVSALQAAGLTGFTDDAVHVSVVHNIRAAGATGVRVHKVIRRVGGELATTGLPRVRSPYAAVRAAHWAVSDRQAALVLAMPVQQRLVTGAQLVDAARAIRGRNRRGLIQILVRDIADGAQSLGELDFAALCRGRGLPEPERQAVRRERGGRVYLDARWDCGLVVEIDGSGHRAGLAVTDDHLRANAVSIDGDVVLRMDLLGLRLEAEAFMDQVVTAYQACRARGHAA